MILVIGGTADSRQLAAYLSGMGAKVTLSVATPLGARVFQEKTAIELVQQIFTEETLPRFISEKNITAVVDASHPFAIQVSQLAQRVCGDLGLPYLRFERPELGFPEHPLLLPVDNWQQAAATARQQAGTVFLAVGVKPLPILHEAGLMNRKPVVARVLPEENSIALCKQYDIAEIVALRGVAAKELNCALFRQYDIGVVITKDSGSTGGTPVKVEAALSMSLPIVVVRRPRVDYIRKVTSHQGVSKFLKGRGLL
ncbi:precorrin-6A reductase [Metallumcola ferriviriculae]|uniref:Precorrin-6A reductase n=1 Tax=Metallumcola ferriviriculae TaxID=3039180 RepID=A0AAU0UL17_9FIRM|nr:precorrin-6A reductase [Desulfitibacteraceae bacterium MK1]